MGAVSLIGTGYVADFYMRSLKTFPNIAIKWAYDRNHQRLAEFCAYWGVSAASSIQDLLEKSDKDDLILNLTNPGEHFNVSFACLDYGRHVYSEKPLATDMGDAYKLHALAAERGLLITSAPCSLLGQAPQTLWHAVRSEIAGEIRLVYAELDDDYLPQAPYRRWVSESGAPWPYDDEFRVGCTVEHAGYYLTWLIAIFGPVRTVVAASAEIVAKAGEGPMAPDLSVATLFFECGVVARLTCSIVARHNHSLRLIGSRGVLEIDESWNNTAKVRFRPRFVVRRKLVNSPVAKSLPLRAPAHPKVGRRGAQTMNFALGPSEMLAAIKEHRDCLLTADFALHVNEVTLAIQGAGEHSGSQRMKTTCGPIQPLNRAAMS